MKITKGKYRSSNEFQIDERLEMPKSPNKPIITAELPLDDELWDDWQRVLQVDRKHSVI